MFVPETTMYKYDRMVLLEDNIWLARKSIYVLSKSKTQSMEQRTDQHLWFSVGTRDPRHIQAASLGGNMIYHETNLRYSLFRQTIYSSIS